jgi:sugar phosphate isomerase/epimerase
MEVIFFTKFLKSLNPEQIGEAVRPLRVDGLDLAIRGGYTVNPSNVKTALAPALRVWADMGLSVPLATLEGGATNPDDPTVRTIFEACGNAGIPFVKLGYWGWRPGEAYWDGVRAIRKALEGFTALGEANGVCSLVHTHSGHCYGLNASAAMHLVDGFDPKRVGVYLDPAHLAADGEPLGMALSIVGDHLRLVGVKNVRYERTVDGHWRHVWSALDDGLVNWRNAVKRLAEVRFDGVLSLHGEYSASEETEAVLTMATADAVHLRACLDAAR